jgi:hypothetical protein
MCLFQNGEANEHFWQLELARLEFKLYGGSLQLVLDVEEVTHVIVSSETRYGFHKMQIAMEA